MRKELLKSVKRVVIKIGSRVLTDSAGALDMAVVSRICNEIAVLRRQGLEVIVVSSGAIAAGRSELGLTDKPRAITIPHKQAAAAVGQTRLMLAYENSLAPNKLKAAQVLLTGEDLGSRQRFRCVCDRTFGVIGVSMREYSADTVI